MTEEIPIEKIVVPIYQRELNEKRVRRLVAEWNSAQCQNYRTLLGTMNGTFNVIVPSNVR